MENSLVQLDYRVYWLARLLSEDLDLGELVSVSMGSLNEAEEAEATAPTKLSLAQSTPA